MPQAKSKAHVAAVDASEMSAAGASGAAAFNTIVDTQSLAEDIRAGRVIQGVDPSVNTLESVPYRRYMRKVIAESGVADSVVTRQLTSHVCGLAAALPFVPSKTEIVDDEHDRTEFDVQVRVLADAAEQQLRSSTGGTAAALTVPSRRLAATALELRVADPDGSKGLAWVNAPLPAERPGGEGGRFDDGGMPVGANAIQRELVDSGQARKARAAQPTATDEDLDVEEAS